MVAQRFYLALGLVICASAAAISNDHLQIFFSEKVLHRIPKIDKSPVTSDGISQMILGSLGLPTTVIGSESKLEVPDVFNTAKINVFVVVESSDGIVPLEIPNTFSNVDSYEIAVGGNYLSIPHILSVSNALKYGSSARHLCVAREVCKFDGSDSVVHVDQSQLDSTGSLASEIAPSLAGNNAIMQELARVASIPKLLDGSEGTRSIVTVVLSTLRHVQEPERVEAAKLLSKVVTDLFSELHGAYGDSLVAEVLTLAGELPSAMEYSPVLSNVLQLQRRLLSNEASPSPSNVTTPPTNVTTPPTNAPNETISAPSNVTSPKNSSDSSPPTADDIARYQVILWTSVLLAVALFTAIGSLITMDVGRDSLLYAKFQTDGTHRKAD